MDVMKWVLMSVAPAFISLGKMTKGERNRNIEDGHLDLWLRKPRSPPFTYAKIFHPPIAEWRRLHEWRVRLRLMVGVV